ncbi:hypothetical protein OsccyDRAFT_2555 [Leptolyngbyaceae cyanobacterium JSC-12]|nr:hypothetical protein OsccyDRAFT_2555 [Leptolyngbyaceae cyanobacterium JSC-12]
MDTLQKQLNALTAKVDALHQLIEQLSFRVSDIVTECKIGANQPNQWSDSGAMIGHRHSRSGLNLDPSMEHKDVLIDNTNLDLANQNAERQLSPEIQIQRLTAQLTAAYSRIAALEEQLISQRIHS